MYTISSDKSNKDTVTFNCDEQFVATFTEFLKTQPVYFGYNDEYFLTLNSAKKSFPAQVHWIQRKTNPFHCFTYKVLLLMLTVNFSLKELRMKFILHLRRYLLDIIVSQSKNENCVLLSFYSFIDTGRLRLALRTIIISSSLLDTPESWREFF